MSSLYLGVDTSNYTTSVSCVSTEGIVFERRTMLSVPLGERGLRAMELLHERRAKEATQLGHPVPSGPTAKGE